MPEPDVALEQALHRRRAREVAVDLSDRLLLVLGQLERERGAVALDQLARLGQRLGERPLALGGSPRERELEHEQLVEGEPLPALLGLRERARLMNGHECVGSERKPAVALHRSRQGVGMITGVLERGRDQLAQLRRRHLLARRVDGREVGRRRAAVQVVGLDREAEAVLLSRAAARACRA